jgi:hypothetical protein
VHESEVFEACLVETGIRQHLDLLTLTMEIIEEQLLSGSTFRVDTA